jgi:hypothetical protein
MDWHHLANFRGILIDGVVYIADLEANGLVGRIGFVMRLLMVFMYGTTPLLASVSRCLLHIS